MGYLAAVKPVLKNQIKCPTGELLTPIFGAAGPHAALALDPGVSKLFPQRVNRLERKVTPVDLDNDASLGVVDGELAVFHIIPQGRHAAHPHALFLGGGDLVADPFAGDFPLELGEGQEDIQGQPSHAGGGVELLGDRHEGDATAVKDVDKLGKIGERARQPVNLIDDDHVDLAFLDIGDQPFQGWPLHRWKRGADKHGGPSARPSRAPDSWNVRSDDGSGSSRAAHRP